MPDLIEIKNKTYKKQTSAGGRDDYFYNVLKSHYKQLSTYDNDDVIDYNYYRDVFYGSVYNVIELCNSIQYDKDTARVKIFIDEGLSESDYKYSYDLYVEKKAFNNDIYNKVLCGKVYGIHGYNFTLNKRKPYLEPKNTGFEVPYRVTAADAAMIVKMSMWLSNIDLKTLEDKFYIKLDVTKTELLDFDIVDRHDVKFDYLPMKILSIADPIEIADTYEASQITKDELLKILNTEFFKSKLWAFIRLIDSHKVGLVIDSFYANLWFRYKDAIIDYFIKDIDCNISKTITELTEKIFERELIGSLLIADGYYTKEMLKIRDMWDNKLSINNFFMKGVYGTMPSEFKQCYENALMLMNRELQEVESDKVYYFIAGQIVSYLVTKSKAKEKTGRMFEPFLKASNVEKLKNEIQNLYQRYIYAMRVSPDNRFNTLYFCVLDYSPKTTLKENKLIFQAGLIGKNVIFTKKKDNKSPDSPENHDCEEDFR